MYLQNLNLTMSWLWALFSLGHHIFPETETETHIRNSYSHSLNESNVLRLCVADNLAQVIACHCKGITVPVTELGATDLCVRHTLIVQMSNL